MSDDRTLLTAWQGGDERAGRTLVGRHYEAVARFFATKDRAAAPDLIQQTLVKLVESVPRISQDCNVRAYVLGIARHVLYDHFRAVYRAPAQLDFSERSLADLQPGPSSVLAREQQTRLLLQALRQIPLESQLLVELYFWEALTAREVAELLAVPEGTVRTRLRRARQLLEQALARLAESPGLLASTLADLDGWALRVREELRSP
ncbi:RNA polymerase sigma factor [Nannocystis bainbridge]|uniref:Sigma-70 family RNA polymerase sigma factor n=1 Tax=Nannocystis bainbridge TaxID=2995303 RepID=A0ABT5DPQ3_9BACT|nr:sigma-70 family RNA polymerase sigma factor [Nannocystis bainbridge]MDC0715634.1 sigma-70 family RNA polymerase sigma factor [Nannocystis bainbridge]